MQKFNEDTGNRNNSPPIEIHQQDPEINGSEILEKNENGDSRNQGNFVMNCGSVSCNFKNSVFIFMLFQ